MNNKCLMIKTEDERKFFTEEKNYAQIEDFAKMFKAEISVVETTDCEVLKLEELAPAICNANYKSKNNEYNILEIKFPESKKKRKQIVNNSKVISEYIEQKLKNNNEVSLKELIKTFKNIDVTSACLCSHFKKTREKLAEKGYCFKKTAGGTYKATCKKNLHVAL